MKKITPTIIFLFIFSFFNTQKIIAQANNSLDTTAKSNVFVVIKDIKIIGNKKTLARTIEREMLLQRGDTVALSQLNLEAIKLRIFNTGLFNDVTVNLKDWDDNNHINIEITVSETFFIIPMPIFALADRNFNVWWTEQNRSLERINYGFFLTHRNLTGQRDPLQILAQFGYTKKMGVSYSLPPLNRAQTLGAVVSFAQSRNREIGFRTRDNILRFNRNDKQEMIRNTQVTVGLRYRPQITATHAISLSYSKINIADTIASELNPDYLGNGKTQQRVTALTYSFLQDKRNFRAYPTSGFLVSGAVSYNGLMKNDDFSNVPIGISWEQYIPITKSMTLELISRGRMDLANRKDVPFNFNRGIGFGTDYLRGYELYVVDGVQMGFVRSSLRQRIWRKDINFGKLMPFPNFRLLPIEVNISGNFDVGGVRNPQALAVNTFQNRTLWSYGTSVDFILYKTIVVQMQYSITHEGRGGFFLHFRSY